MIRNRNICNLFFENQPNEICSHLSEKVSKGRFLNPKKLQNYRNERKGKEKKKQRGEGKEAEEKKNNGCARSFYNSYSGDSFWRRKLNCWAQKVHSVHNKQILKGGSYKVFDNLGAATWKDPSPIAEP